MTYKVKLLDPADIFLKDTYEVLIAAFAVGHFEPVFQGSLSDCAAYIQLKQNEDVDSKAL